MIADRSNANCIITGATSGIGRMAAEALAVAKANVILVGRNERAGHRVVRGLQRQVPGPSFEFVRADLSRPDDVRLLAGRIRERWDRVDVLINNAGARFDDYRETSEGIELTFATNHLGHFLLTCLVADLLVRAPQGRVITVSSGSHFVADGRGDWSIPRRNYDRRLSYAKSKLANVMFAYELAERLKDTSVTSNALEPGGVASNFARNNGIVAWLRHLVGHTITRDLVLPRKGAETIVYLATSVEVAGTTGKYFRRKHVAESSAASRDRTEGRRLWQLSLEMTAARQDPSFDLSLLG
jgi:NAD(P)-dependent dehydrogenase (short-subunit alcohol dehydrogenase family)